METKSERIFIRFTPSERKAIEEKAEEECRTISNLVRMIVLAYVNGKK